MKQKTTFPKRLFRFFSSYGLAVTVMLLMMVVVFFGTIAQNFDGLHEAQKKYFDSFIVMWEPSPGWHIPVMPGGFLLMMVLFVNMLCGAIIRARKRPRAIGILIAHSSILLMLAGGFISFIWKSDGLLTLAEGQRSNVFVSFNERVLEIEPLTTDPKAAREAWEVSYEKFKNADGQTYATFQNGSLPFGVTVERFIPNCEPLTVEAASQLAVKAKDVPGLAKEVKNAATLQEKAKKADALALQVTALAEKAKRTSALAVAATALADLATSMADKASSTDDKNQKAASLAEEAKAMAEKAKKDPALAAKAKEAETLAKEASVIAEAAKKDTTLAEDGLALVEKASALVKEATTLANNAPAQAIDGVFLIELKVDPTIEMNHAGIYVNVTPKDGSPAHREILVDNDIFDPWTVASGGTNYVLRLTRKHWKTPFLVRLDSAKQENYPRTMKPRAYTSQIAMIENGEENTREISMNQPLRSQGYAVFQTTMGPVQLSSGRIVMRSGFEVASNPSDHWPLVSCVLVGIGLLIHFMQSLVAWMGRMKAVGSKVSGSKAEA